MSEEALDWFNTFIDKASRDGFNVTQVDVLSSTAIKAIATIRAALNEWQPIETAPRNGVRVLLYRPKTHPNNRITINTAKFIKNYWTLGGGVYWGDTEPTHWKHLPKPPIEESE